VRIVDFQSIVLANRCCALVHRVWWQKRKENSVVWEASREGCTEQEAFELDLDVIFIL
jgi:hypothetical protein